VSGGFGWLRLSFWLTVWLVLVWLVVVLPFVCFAALASGDGVPWAEMALAVLVMAGASLVALLPFLVLSFANAFFGGRLRQLLHLPADGPASARSQRRPSACQRPTGSIVG